MKEILVISGKGGAGKTSVTGAFAHLASGHVICDLDVDAPDLHLLLQPDKVETHEFYSGHKAAIRPDLCSSCGLCAEKCRFGAISESENSYRIAPLKCEGCKVCVHFCPTGAIEFPENHCGQWFYSETRFGPLVHAQLFPGEENSGRLVALLRNQAKSRAKAQGRKLVLCDGAPGIGCPVISSLSGIDLAVIVTEPTPSGRHDMERVMDLCGHFKIQSGVIVNKFDLNLDETARIRQSCSERGIELLAELPHDPAMTKAMVAGQVITEFLSDGLAAQVRTAWKQIERLIDGASNK